MNEEQKTRILKEAALAATSIVSSPVAHGMKVVGALLGRPDLAATAIALLQDDVVRLYEMIECAHARLDEEAKVRINADELVEIIMQVHVNMGRTTSTRKRALMRNVVVNGISAGDADGLQVRLLAAAVLELEVEQVELLREAEEGDGIVQWPDGDMGFTLVQGLAARGFVRQIERAGLAYNAPTSLPVPPTYEVTKTGQLFLDYLAEPQVGDGDGSMG